MARARASRQKGLNQEPPKRLADELARFYARMNSRALTLIRRLLVPAMNAEDPAAIALALRRIDRALQSEFSDEVIERRARRTAETLNRRNRSLFFEGLAAAAGVRIIGSAGAAGGGGGAAATISAGSRGPRLIARLNFNPTIMVDNFVDRNIRYISTLRNGMVQAVGDQVARSAVLGGQVTGAARVEATRAELTQRLLVQWREQGVPSLIPTRRLKLNGQPVMVRAENHAALIARDQIATLNGQLNRARQTAAGITEFVWETMRDDRVRETHEELQGERFTWTDGWDGVFPGEPINCRCWARAVVDRDQILSSGDFIPVDASGPFTERNRPGVPQINPGPGSREAFVPGPFDR
jgi:SPP1 gp7 family putative phage head morphogenesis protein